MKLYRYRVPLTEPFLVEGRAIEFREGLMLHAPEREHSAWSEAAPLPGWSQETLEDVIEAARGGNWNAYPSLQFAYEVLHDDRLPFAPHVHLNGLLQGDPQRVLEQADQFASSSWKTLKLKVGRMSSVAEEARFVVEVAYRLRPDQRLRLDANRSWAWDDAVEFGQTIRQHLSCIDYLEEPLQDPTKLERWREATGLDYALDETLRETEDLERFSHAAALVIKPTLQGYSQRAFEKLRAYQIPLVLSGCYESGVGLYHLARLASYWSTAMAHGLDTYRRLGKDVLQARWNLDDGQFHAPSGLALSGQHFEEIV